MLYLGDSRIIRESWHNYMPSAIYLILAFNTGKKGGLQMFTGFTYLLESTHVQISPKKKKDVK